MFDTLSDRLEGVFKKLKGQGRITERNIEDALREVRLALLEADVNIKVVRDFIEHVKSKALGAEVLRSLSPEQHLIKFVATELQNAMGGTARELDLKVKPPVKIMVVGLQGSGKTTSIAKLALWLKSERKRHPILASTDVYRPAAMEQLRVLGAQAQIPVLDSNEKQDPIEIASRAMARAETGGHDAILIDTAGRLQIDEELMDELARLKAALNPHHIIFVADAMTGQEAANVAAGFHERLGHFGRHSDQARLRRARRRGAFGAHYNRRADSVRGDRREARRVRDFLSGPADLAHPRDGRRADADREGAAELRSDQGQGARAQVQEERVHDHGLRRADQGDQEDGLARRADGHDPRAQETRGRGGFRRGETSSWGASRRLSTR